MHVSSGLIMQIKSKLQEREMVGAEAIAKEVAAACSSQMKGMLEDALRSVAREMNASTISPRTRLSAAAQAAASRLSGRGASQSDLDGDDDRNTSECPSMVRRQLLQPSRSAHQGMRATTCEHRTLQSCRPGHATTQLCQQRQQQREHVVRAAAKAQGQTRQHRRKRRGLLRELCRA